MMYVENGIAYAEGPAFIRNVVNIRPLKDFRLLLKFNTGEIKTFDFTPLLKSPAFMPLSNVELFNDVYIDYGVPTWDDGSIDISPDFIYQNGTPLEGDSSSP
ncbi:MAG: DUF2442 domain-containing protein [Holosporales bacterium]|jgi:hypothetical protein|nr:DUF2442 domain-containing protein [Holosporales bacterium]